MPAFILTAGLNTDYGHTTLVLLILTLITILQIVFRYERGHASGLVALDDVSFSESCLFDTGPPCKVKPFEILKTSLRHGSLHTLSVQVSHSNSFINKIESHYVAL